MNLLKLIAAGTIFTSFNCLHAMEIVRQFQAESKAQNFQNLSEEQQMAADYWIFKEVIFPAEKKMLAMMAEISEFADLIPEDTYDVYNERFEEILRRYEAVRSEVKTLYSENSIIGGSSEQKTDFGTLFGEELKENPETIWRQTPPEPYWTTLWKDRSIASSMSEEELQKWKDEKFMQQTGYLNYTSAMIDSFNYFYKGVDESRRIMRLPYWPEKLLVTYLRKYFKSSNLRLRTHMERTDDLIGKIEEHFGISPRVEMKD